MGQLAAKQGDRITAMDSHTIPTPPFTVSVPFTGVIDGGLSGDVKIMGRAAAVVGSTATNLPPHPPNIVPPPKNRGTILTGSATVKINGKPAARMGDTAMTCNDPTDLPVGQVVGSGTVSIG
jgi:uncharacterized Zn-binding protein involved in type VI secretion